MTDAEACDFPEARRLIKARTLTTYKAVAENTGGKTLQSPADATKGTAKAKGVGPESKVKKAKKDEVLVRHFVSSLGTVI